MADKSSTFIERVVIKNYKSIAACDVELGPLTFLVGPNGSGKSNFLDALRFTADALSGSLDHAIRDRGGIAEVRRRSAGHPNHFGVRLHWRLGSGESGTYAFRIGAKQRGGYEVQEEYARNEPILSGGFDSSFRVQSGDVVEWSPGSPSPPASPDRLYLVHAAGLPEFRPLYDGLSRMGFYNLNPDRIRDLQSPDAGELLTRDGGNIASVLGQLDKKDRSAKDRIEEYLARVAPGVTGVAPRPIGPKDTLEFRQDVVGSKNPWRFLAANMSDGTLRATGLLVALFQSGNGVRPRVPLIGIEEPEAALHPAAAGVLFDALREASSRTQVVVTSHSPDLLDNEGLPAESILAVQSVRGETQIAPMTEAGRSALRDRLYSAGELLRMGQLEPDREIAARATQASLFDFEG